MPRSAPYVGVSGITNPAHQLELEQVAAATALTPRRALLLGVKAVHKTQFLDVENKYGPAWYPVGADALRDALAPRPLDSSTMPVAQLYLDVDHVNDPTYRAAFMDRVAQRGRPWLRGVQFDMLPWHVDPAIADFLTDLKDRLGLLVLVQCHSPAMTELGPRGAATALSRLAPAVDYILFDSSHGTGRRLDVGALSHFVAAAYDEPALDQVGVAVAGGLDADAVREDLPVLLEQFPDLSWDAEGALHPVAPDGSRPLHLPTATAYLRASADVLSGATSSSVGSR